MAERDFRYAFNPRYGLSTPDPDRPVQYGFSPYFNRLYNPDDFVTDYSAPVAPDTSLSSVFQKGLQSGAENMAANLELFKGIANSISGNEEALQNNLLEAERLQGYASSAMEGIERFDEFLDQPTFSGFATQVSSAVGQVGPSALASIIAAVATGGASVLGRLATGGIAKSAIRNIADKELRRVAIKDLKKMDLTPDEKNLLDAAYSAYRTQRSLATGRTFRGGATLGALGQEYPQGAGTSFGIFAEQGMIDPVSAFTSLGIGAPYAAVGVLGERLLVDSFLNIAKAGPRGPVRSRILSGLGTGLLRGGATEGATEALQESMSVAQKFSVDEDYNWAQARLDLAQATFMGFFGGAGIGGAGGTVAGALSRPNQIMDDAREAVKAGYDQATYQAFQNEQFGIGEDGQASREPTSSLEKQFRSMFGSETGRDSVFIPVSSISSLEELLDPARGTDPELIKQINNVGRYEVNPFEVDGQTKNGGILFSTNQAKLNTLKSNMEASPYNTTVLDNTLVDILGYQHGRLPNADRVVVVKDENGVVVWDQATDKENENSVRQKARELHPGKNFTISVADPAAHLKERAKAVELEEAQARARVNEPTVKDFDSEEYFNELEVDDDNEVIDRADIEEVFTMPEEELSMSSPQDFGTPQTGTVILQTLANNIRKETEEKTRVLNQAKKTRSPEEVSFFENKYVEETRASAKAFTKVSSILKQPEYKDVRLDPAKVSRLYEAIKQGADDATVSSIVSQGLTLSTVDPTTLGQESFDPTTSDIFEGADVPVDEEASPIRMSMAQQGAQVEEIALGEPLGTFKSQRGKGTQGARGWQKQKTKVPDLQQEEYRSLKSKTSELTPKVKRYSSEMQKNLNEDNYSPSLLKAYIEYSEAYPNNYYVITEFKPDANSESRFQIQRLKTGEGTPEIAPAIPNLVNRNIKVESRREQKSGWTIRRPGSDKAEPIFMSDIVIQGTKLLTKLGRESGFYETGLSATANAFVAFNYMYQQLQDAGYILSAEGDPVTYRNSRLSELEAEFIKGKIKGQTDVTNTYNNLKEQVVDLMLTVVMSAKESVVRPENQEGKLVNTTISIPTGAKQALMDLFLPVPKDGQPSKTFNELVTEELQRRPTKQIKSDKSKTGRRTIPRTREEARKAVAEKLLYAQVMKRAEALKQEKDYSYEDQLFTNLIDERPLENRDSSIQGKTLTPSQKDLANRKLIALEDIIAEEINRFISDPALKIVTPTEAALGEFQQTQEFTVVEPTMEERLTDEYESATDYELGKGKKANRKYSAKIVPSTLLEERLGMKLTPLLNAIKNIYNFNFPAFAIVSSESSISSIRDIFRANNQELTQERLDFIQERQQEINEGPSKIGRHISFNEDGPSLIILKTVENMTLRQKGKALWTLGHELVGHALFKTEITKLKNNSELYERLYKEFEKARDAEGAPNAYQGEFGFEEWWSDSSATFLFNEALPARNFKDSYFKRIANVIRKLYDTISKNSRMFQTNETFNEYMRGVIESRTEAINKGQAIPIQQSMQVKDVVEKIIPKHIDKVIPKPMQKKIKQAASEVVTNLRGSALAMALVFDSENQLKALGEPGKALARMLYKATGTKGEISYQDAVNNKRTVYSNRLNEILGMDRTQTELSPQAREALVEALDNRIDTKDLTNPMAVDIRNLFDAMYRDENLQSIGVFKRNNFFPIILNEEAIMTNDVVRDKVVELLIEYNKEGNETLSQAEAAKIVDGLADKFAAEPSIKDAAGEFQIGSLKSRSKYFAKIPTKELYDVGALEDPAIAAYQYINNTIRNAEWEKRGGEARANELLLQIPEGDKRNSAALIVKAGLGKPIDGDIGKGLRTFNSWALLLQVYLHLGFTFFASLTDVAGSAIRAREFKQIPTFFKTVINAIKDPEEAARFGSQVGVVATDALNLTIMNMQELDIMNQSFKTPAVLRALGVSETLNPLRMSESFFKVTGTDFITRWSRNIAAGMGREFIVEHYHRAKRGEKRSIRYLEELNLTDMGKIEAWIKDNLDVTKHPELRTAVGAFAEESVVRPNAMERPLYASDARFAIVWQLKSFFYSYGKKVLGGIYREMRSRAQEGSSFSDSMLPLALAGALLLPISALGLDLRERFKVGFAWLLPGVSPETKNYRRSLTMDPGEYTFELLDRAGAFGPFALAFPLFMASERYGKPFWVPPLGPTVETGYDLLDGRLNVDDVIPGYSWL